MPPRARAGSTIGSDGAIPSPRLNLCSSYRGTRGSTELRAPLTDPPDGPRQSFRASRIEILRRARLVSI